MQKYQQLFIDRLEENGVKYAVDDNHVKVGFKAENLESIVIILSFSKEDNPTVQLTSTGFLTFDKENGEAMIAALITCNVLNSQYRWAKLYVSDEGVIHVEADAILTEEAAGAIAEEMMYRLLRITDEAYVILKRAKDEL